MRQRRYGHKRRADVLTLALLAAAALCLATGKTDVYRAAAVFARSGAGPQTVTLLLPGQEWYLLRDGGKAVAACSTLIEAQIAQDARASGMEISTLKAQPLELRITAEKPKADALQEAAGIVERTLSALRAMEALEEPARVEFARLREAEVTAAWRKIRRQLNGVENPVAMGLAGLVGACRETLAALAKSAEDHVLQQVRADLAQQYAAYVEYASGIREEE